jgi:hypothetical protein
MKLSMPSGGQYRATVRVQPRIHLTAPGAFLVAALATLAIAIPARAQSCSVAVSGASTAAWHQAASGLQLSGSAGDCASIHLELLATGARLTFTTRDGRRAERLLSDPAELEATIAALAVTDLRSEPTAEPSRQSDSQLPKPAPAAASPRRSVAESEPSSEASPDSQPTYSLQAGSRGGADRLISVVLNGSASLVLQRWELGVGAAIDFQYFTVGSSPGEAPGSAVVAGVTIGRREQIDNTAVLVGSRLMIAALNDEREVDTGERGGAEIRTGAYLGLVFPRRSPARFRTELGAELVPHDLGGRVSRSSEGPVTPWWAVSLLAGVELGG